MPEVNVPSGDFHGRIIDGTTGQPIEGAIVVANWSIYALSVAPVVHGHETTLQDVAETVTDAQGKFIIANLGVNNPPLGWKPHPGAYPRFMAFKSGYATRFWNQNQWSGRSDSYGNPLLSSDVAPLYQNEPGLVFPLYENANDRSFRPNLPQPTRYSSAAAAAGFLSNNVLDAVFRPRSIDVHQAIQRQIRALVTVDEEFQQAAGKKFSWNSPEIVRAINEATGKPQVILKTKRPSRGGAALADPSAPTDTKIKPNVPSPEQKGLRAP